MKPRVYIETTILSYLVARHSRDLIIAAHQQITLDWWDDDRSEYDVFVSQLVLEECGRGDPEIARERLRIVQQLEVLELTEETRILARGLLKNNAVPRKAAADALHIAIAAVHGMDYLLTWNCAHIANAATRAIIERLCRTAGFVPPVICTPEELTEE